MNLVLGNINHHFCNYAFQGFLNNGNVVAIKKYKFEEIYRKPCTYDLRLISKLQHKNLVKILGYVDGVEPSMKETKRHKNLIAREVLKNGIAVPSFWYLSSYIFLVPLKTFP